MPEPITRAGQSLPLSLVVFLVKMKLQAVFALKNEELELSRV